MSIFKIQFVSLYRIFVDHLNVHQPAQYNFIIDMDTRICALITSLPAYFSDGNVAPHDPRTPNLVKETLLIRITAANRHLRLHRPYLMRGYTDKQYAASKDRCVTSAHAVLTLLQIAGQRCPELFRLWIISFYGFVAVRNLLLPSPPRLALTLDGSQSIVAFIDLTRNPSDATRAALHETVALFKRVESTSAGARNAISLLQGLLGEPPRCCPTGRALTPATTPQPPKRRLPLRASPRPTSGVGLKEE